LVAAGDYWRSTTGRNDNTPVKLGRAKSAAFEIRAAGLSPLVELPKTGGGNPAALIYSPV